MTASAAGNPERRVALVDLLDRVLAGGVVIAGDVTLSIADIDMVQISLRTLISSVRALQAPPPDHLASDRGDP
ncbi:gas vesicle protein [Rhodococcus maanshanensis]|uniref:Gas vesicle protein n=1 Tax=Rhodococcus maanshanensis TaxID=183556 RepID=A0A1H7LTD6_9NOCA|nr:gas vesicle protein [Rhodococcus maanshanensis]SEL01607.1 Gas vesicle protein [Rhodococcus maanshanensis]